DYPTAAGLLGPFAARVILPPAVDVGAGVERVLEQVLERHAIGPAPDQLAFARPLTHAHANPDVMPREVAQDTTERAQLFELAEDEPHHLLHLLVRVELELVVRAPHVAGRQREGELAPSRLAQTALVHPLLEQVQFG